VLATVGRVRRGAPAVRAERGRQLWPLPEYGSARRGRAGSCCFRFRPRSPATRRPPVGRPNCGRTNNWGARGHAGHSVPALYDRIRHPGPPDSFHTPAGAPPPPPPPPWRAAGEAERDNRTSEPARPLSRRGWAQRNHATRDTKAASGQAARHPMLLRYARHIKLGAKRGRKQRLKGKGTCHLLWRYFARPIRSRSARAPRIVQSRSHMSSRRSSRRVRRSGSGWTSRRETLARAIRELQARCNAPGTGIRSCLKPWRPRRWPAGDESKQESCRS
jgi:hypothetical protein